ncbi:ankyrin repeat and KH domain-containing protein mask-like [Culex pipiens pallens]|uniref:ankyrin repeat and KH domain-containing protein mask-like n=1 Tax=Culex pipiens pallens TaxID=42434 RepID=UPI001952EF55|nr:ankyrin repeat and KH domain-containing protein mask-like [Culex pipiens pallens]XP_039436032.1 ankyrin repeat and KH domain-containing protein mask-like [Culex pipiens pallens]
MAANFTCQDIDAYANLIGINSFCKTRWASNQNQLVTSGTLSPVEDDSVGNLNLADAEQCGFCSRTRTDDVQPKPADLAGSASAAESAAGHQDRIRSDGPPPHARLRTEASSSNPSLCSTWTQQPQTGRPPALIPVDASGMPTKIAKKSDKSRKEKNRLAGVRQAPVDQQSAAAAAAVPGGYQFEVSPAPAPIQNPAGNVVQERQIDVDSETDSNHDTAGLAYAGGHEELVELLISRGTNIEHKDKKGFTPLILAATAGHEKVVETLLRHGAKMDPL